MSSAGVAFTAPADGDMRADPTARRHVAERLGVGSDWATVEQVHGSSVASVDRSGQAGRADALITTTAGLPLAVFTADCLGVVLGGSGTVAVAHAGWRGLADGVLENTLRAMDAAGGPAQVARIGPAIGPCCFEVGDDVADLFDQDVATTTWGTTSVDLPAAARRRLSGLEVNSDGRCTACQGGPSHRRDATTARMAALGWLS